MALSANTIARPRTALVMALDRSGSMDDPAGDGRLKIQLVRDGAAVVPLLAVSETGLGAVRWDTDADLAGAMEVVEAGEENIGLGRNQLSTFIANHFSGRAGHVVSEPCFPRQNFSLAVPFHVETKCHARDGISTLKRP